MTNEPVRRAVRRPAAPAGLATRTAPHGSGGQHPGGHRRSRAAHRRATLHRETGMKNLVHGRRRRAQLRRQRPAAARGTVREHLDSAGRGRCGRRAGRGALRLASAAGPAARAATATARRGQPSRSARIRPTRSRRFCESVGAHYTRYDDEAALLDDVAQALVDEKGRSAGSTAGWSSGRARSAPAASSAIPGRRACRRR